MDYVFWTIATVAVLLTGLSKGGFAGIGTLSLPLLALVIPPIQAAAIMLPILMVQDCVSVWAYRKSFDKAVLRVILTGSMVGIALGGLTASYVSNDMIKIMVGIIAAAFALKPLLRGTAGGSEASKPGTRSGLFWGVVAGFTSFIANAGAPPFQVYVLPQRLAPTIYAGTATMFFAVVNFVKFVVFTSIGQVSMANLNISFALFPIAIAGTFVGIWLVKRFDARRFYAIIYGLTLVIGLFLIGDGIVSLIRHS